MSVRTLKLNSPKRDHLPTLCCCGQYQLTDEDIQLYQMLAPYPKAPLEDCEIDEKTKNDKDETCSPKSTPETKPDFHPVDCPPQFPSEPE
jgi:hypothetical protein